MINLKGLLMSLVVLVPTIVIHELAHGYVALLLGDDTAKNQGRLTLNPLAHLNLPGLISLLLFRFGWANPVPVNFSNLRYGRIGIILVSIAGVCANLVVAVIASIVFVLINTYAVNFYYGFFGNAIYLLLIYNVSLAVFNLVPLPPLDGSKIVVSLLPYKYQFVFYKYEKYFYFVLILLIFSRSISVIIGPLVEGIIKTLLSMSFWILRI